MTDSEVLTIQGALKLAKVRIDVVGENCHPRKPISINCPVFLIAQTKVYLVNNELAKDVVAII